MKADSLNILLRLKEWRKEEIELEIERIQQSIDREEARLRDMEAEFSGNLEDFRSNRAGEAISPDSLRVFHSYFNSMHTKMAQQRESIERKIAELERTRELLVEAYREKMLVENLQGRLLCNETRERTRKEQKELDFLYTSRLNGR